MAILKANAYGHGILKVAQVVWQRSRVFRVALLDEALYLCENGITIPILILGIPASGLDAVVECGFRQTVFDLSAAESLSKTALERGKEAYVHIKVDTGCREPDFIRPGKNSSSHLWVV